MDGSVNVVIVQVFDVPSKLAFLVINGHVDTKKLRYDGARVSTATFDTANNGKHLKVK